MVDKTLNLMFGLALINRPMTEAVEIFNYSETVGPGSGAERVYLDELYERDNQQSTLEERYFVEMEIAAYKFYEYLELPLLWRITRSQGPYRESFPTWSMWCRCASFDYAGAWIPIIAPGLGQRLCVFSLE